jgi:membrane-bound inhibitor of C-type lysozyme
VTFACSPKPGDVLVATFHETEPPSAIFERGGKTVFALIARSGSGARYEAQGVLFWDKGGEARVTWFGAQLKCSARK